jgi:hypothetical protein
MGVIITDYGVVWIQSVASTVFREGGGALSREAGEGRGGGLLTPGLPLMYACRHIMLGE